MSTYDELLALYEQHGKLTPVIVVDAARPADAPLHGHFEWDDAVAAEGFRRVQAAELIRVQRITYTNQGDGEEHSVRRFHSVTRVDGPVYVPVEEVVEDPMTYQIVLRDFERAWRNLQRQYGHLKEFRDITRGEVA